MDTTIFKPIVSICPLTIDDSPHMHLLCITQDGVRLYFATRSIDFGPADQHQQQQHPTVGAAAADASPTTGSPRPYHFHLLHVRLPPGYTFGVSVVKPKSVRSAFFARGSLLMVSTPQQDQDVLWSLSAEPFPLRPYLTESSTIVPLSGQVWSIAAATSTTRSAPSIADTTMSADRVVLLTNQGTHVVAMQRPVHMLRQLLAKCSGPNHDAVRAFFDSMSVPQACAAAVLLACMRTYRNTELGAWAKQAFLLYGGDPQSGIDGSAANRTLMAADAQHIAMSTPFQASVGGAAGQHHNMFQAPFNQSAGSPIGGHQMGRDSPRSQAMAANVTAHGLYTTFSHKHTGLYLHASRVLSRIWTRRCLTAQRQSSVDPEECAGLLEELYAVRGFIESMPVRTSSAIDAYGSGQFSFNSTFRTVGGGQAAARTDDQALGEENRSVGALATLLSE